MEQLRGRNALVTGAAGGLGHYIADALVSEGVNLALSDLPSSPVDDLITELRPRGVLVESVPADLSETNEIEDLARDAKAAIGPLDILVNNAGVEFGKSFLEQTRAELEMITSINLLAVMELTRVVLPGMLERRRGHVVNVASVAGKIASPSRLLCGDQARGRRLHSFAARRVRRRAGRDDRDLPDLHQPGRNVRADRVRAGRPASRALDDAAGGSR